ncbi:hypothetical protein ACJX0J_019141, partial [Zea mays]
MSEHNLYKTSVVLPFNFTGLQALINLLDGSTWSGVKRELPLQTSEAYFVFGQVSLKMDEQEGLAASRSLINIYETTNAWHALVFFICLFTSMYTHYLHVPADFFSVVDYSINYCERILSLRHIYTFINIICAFYIFVDIHIYVCIICCVNGIIHGLARMKEHFGRLHLVSDSRSWPSLGKLPKLWIPLLLVSGDSEKICNCSGLGKLGQPLTCFKILKRCLGSTRPFVLRVLGHKYTVYV